MKSKILVIVSFGIIIAACTKDKTVVTPKNSGTNPSPHLAQRLPDSSDMGGSRFIPMSLANDMISSYLYSINYTQNDSDVRSYSIDADSLRAYLSLTGIKNVKLIFAHTQSFMSSSSTYKYAGYQSGALTIIIAGYDASGNYVYYNGNVLDHAAPCPYTCAPGSAGKDLLE